MDKQLLKKLFVDKKYKCLCLKEVAICSLSGFFSVESFYFTEN
jgi:hypothetical protein